MQCRIEMPCSLFLRQPIMIHHFYWETKEPHHHGKSMLTHFLFGHIWGSMLGFPLQWCLETLEETQTQRSWNTMISFCILHFAFNESNIPFILYSMMWNKRSIAINDSNSFKKSTNQDAMCGAFLNKFRRQTVWIFYHNPWNKTVSKNTVKHNPIKNKEAKSEVINIKWKQEINVVQLRWSTSTAATIWRNFSFTNNRVSKCVQAFSLLLPHTRFLTDQKPL